MVRSATHVEAPRLDPAVSGGVFLAWLIVYGWLFAPYFHTGELGGDYTYFLPKLLDEYIHARINGWLSPQWFTPSFCGGFPGLPNPQSTYWSAPHFLLIFLGPTQAMFVTMLMFAAAGWWGMYLYLERSHPGWPAMIGALLFASNGYHISRMLEGHVGHHGFMLVPLIAWALSSGPVSINRPESWWRIMFAACLLAYPVIGAGGPIMAQLLAGVLLLLAFSAYRGSLTLASGIVRLLTSGVVASILLGPVLYSTLSFMVVNPRDWFTLPVFESFAESLLYGMEIIVAPWRDSAQIRDVLSDTGIIYEWHELEYGLTVLPVLMIAACVFSMLSARKQQTKPGATAGSALGLAILLTTLPFVLNTDLGPRVNSFIRDLPVLGSTSSLLRWYVLPMLTLVIVTADASRCLLARMPRPGVAGAGFAGLGLLLVAHHYAMGIAPEIATRARSFDPAPIETAYEKLSASPSHSITHIGFRGDLKRNNSFLDRESAQLCYEAALGYKLEGLLIRTVPGPVSLVTAGRYNMLDPACFVYPLENACRPGDRLAADRDAAALHSLANYRPIPFEKPRLHDSLLLLSRLATIVILTSFGFSIYSTWQRHRSNLNRSQHHNRDR